MKHSDSIANIAAAVAAAAAEMPAVPKDSTNPHFKSKFASLDGIIERTKPILAKHGLAIVQGTGAEAVPGTVDVEMMLLHKSGEWLQSQVSMPLVKHDPQGVGSAITYGRRYLVAAMLSLSADEDDDGNATSHKPEAVKAAGKAKLSALDDPGIMPTGPFQGHPLAEVPTSELKALADYCRSKNPGKFAARIIALDTEIDRRADAARAAGELHPALASEEKHQNGLAAVMSG